METIGLQAKARPLEGAIEHYWFENQHVGLARTVFHRIVIPFEPFDSGLEYVQQPERTELVVEWINLGLYDPAALDGVEIAVDKTPEVEASIYLGAAHNWYRIERLTLALDGSRYKVAAVGTAEFSREGLANDERFSFEAVAVYRGAACPPEAVRQGVRHASVKPFIRITRHPYEEPHHLNLVVEASNGRQQGQLEIYANARGLREVAKDLRAFPGGRKETVQWELGSERPEDRFAFYYRLRVFQVAPSGRCAVELRFNNNQDPPDRAVLEFSIEAHPADLDRLADLLLEFSQLKHRVLE